MYRDLNKMINGKGKGPEAEECQVCLGRKSQQALKEGDPDCQSKQVFMAPEYLQRRVQSCTVLLPQCPCSSQPKDRSVKP